MKIMFRVLLVLVLLGVPQAAFAQGVDVAKRLKGFDTYMQKTLEDWNAPAVGVGIVVGDELVFAKGYGYRDYEQKLPFTPKTLVQIASNTKLFTAVGAGLLVAEGKLTWDRPVRESVPSIRFYDDNLGNTVTLRDMLAHRTGITRHDTIWYKSSFTRKELFDRLRYLEPKEPIRQRFLYNNMMYAGVGQIIEIQSGQPWEEFVRQRILDPLRMESTVYTVADLQSSADHGVPFTEKRDSFELYKIPYYEDTIGVAPAGAIISNIDDMSHWLIALMNEGKYEGTQVIPADVLKETLTPALALPNTLGETRGYWELLNAAYGMGRQTASYRGELLTYHGGDLPGFHSQVSFMPQKKIGVIVFVIGNHCAALYNIVSWNVYERLLGMSETPWSDRFLEIRLKGKKAGTEARAKAGEDRVPDTKPSHPLEAYSGEFEHPAYGVLRIELKDGSLGFDFHDIRLPLDHFHYDRFDTPDDEQDGRWSVNFGTNPQGDVATAVMSLDEAEVTFTRRPDQISPELMAKLPGEYETANGFKFKATLDADGTLRLIIPGQPVVDLIPYRGTTFRVKEFSDLLFEFVVEDGVVKALKQRDPSGEYVFTRR